MEKLVIIGSGIAGLTAAIYASRAQLKPIVLTGNEEGGQLMLTTTVENYPGFPDGVIGPELMDKLKKQAQKFGARILTKNAASFKKVQDGYEIGTSDEAITTKAVIIATGASARWLGLDSEKKYKGRGVHTCATCDAYFYRDKEIVVVGGGDSAMEESTFLSKYASKVTIVHRRDELRASKIMQKRIFNNPKIEVIWDTVIEEILGDGKKVNSVKLKNVKTGKTAEFKTDAVFLAVGHVPNVKIFEGTIELNDRGFIKTDRKMRTNLEGVFAAGDVQDPMYKQAVTAAGSGCQAALEAERYLEEL